VRGRARGVPRPVVQRPDAVEEGVDRPHLGAVVRTAGAGLEALDPAVVHEDVLEPGDEVVRVGGEPAQQRAVPARVGDRGVAGVGLVVVRHDP
jgi:hypothetical protein